MQGFGDCLFNPFTAGRHTPQYCLRLKEFQDTLPINEVTDTVNCEAAAGLTLSVLHHAGYG